MSACVNGEEERLGKIDEHVDSILILLPSCLAWETEHMIALIAPKEYAKCNTNVDFLSCIGSYRSYRMNGVKRVILYINFFRFTKATVMHALHIP